MALDQTILTVGSANTAAGGTNGYHPYLLPVLLMLAYCQVDAMLVT